ncbi:MAG: tannase/feruloyl esterase family alpha/beta hydrolase [Proteobacteria bacterium]|nr:tannase/feruloyl esterase family alpha/beta hydrolase [Pseudomonadota bacterium]
MVRPVMGCEALAQKDIAPAGEAPGRIVSARTVTTGTVGPYCEIKGYVAPQVRFELRLPTQNWTQRLMFSGCGGFFGRVEFRIRASEGCEAIDNGEIALVTSDLGHDAPDGNANTVWAANNRQGKIDYGYRGVHVVTVIAKAILARYYGQPQAYAYFNGCSDGGREGMMEAQRYPGDFNGIIAGASVIGDAANNTVFHAWNARQSAAADGAAVLKPQDLAVLHKAALDACDLAGDGVRDGVVGDPRACRFDPAIAACRGGQSQGCLSAAQVAAARAMYGGPVDEMGRPLYFGRPVGSELAWGSPDNGEMVGAFVRYLVSDDILDFDLAKFPFDRAWFDRLHGLASVYNATNPDIDAFQKAGGKLIMWHGWGDPGVPPMSSVTYYESLLKRYGPATASFARLFMLPGVGHCGGGDGPDRMNLTDAIFAWVEDGTAPASVIALRKSYGRTVQTRPVFPYPSNSRYRGAGDPALASSFAEATPQ